MSSPRAFARAFPFCRCRHGFLLLRVLATFVLIGSAWPRAATADSKKTGEASSELDSEHLFGFTEGSDIGERGEKELEADSTGRFGRQGGTYTALSTAFEGKYTATDNFRIGGSATIAAYSLNGVHGFDDRQSLTVQEIAFDLRYRLLDREKAGLGLTFAFEPHRGFADESSGAPVDQHGGKFSVLADKEIVPKWVFAAFNLIYDADVTRPHGSSAVERDSILGTAAAVATQVHPGLFWGAEVRYLRHYDGVALNNFTGDAVYIGPTLYAKLSGNWWLSAAWDFQVAGARNGFAGSLDLADFERRQAKLRLSVSF